MKTLYKKSLSTIAAVGMLSCIFSVNAVATDGTISDPTPGVYFNDTDYTAQEYEWLWESNNPSAVGRMRLYDRVYNNSPIYISNSATDVMALRRYSLGEVCLSDNALCIQHSSTKDNSLYVDSSGDINLANGSMFIDRSAKYVGIGTSVPEEDLHIINTSTESGPYYTTNADASIRLDTYGGSKWALGARYWGSIVGSDNYFAIRDVNSSTAPVVIYQGAANYSITISRSSKVGIGTNSPAAKLDVKGTIKSSDTYTAKWKGSNTVGDGMKVLVTLDANNTASGKVSDVGFRLRNAQKDFQWDFRTIENQNGFTATKQGSHGGEFVVLSPTNDFHDAIVKIGGVVIFENGHLVKADGTPIASIMQEQSTKLATLQKAVESKDAQIALLKKQQRAQALKIAELETMRQKVAMLENLLTNLALKTDGTKQEKVSLNNK